MKRILICEDESDSQQAIKNILLKRGYQVYIAADGKESVEKAKDLSPDLILLDIRMPKIDGLEVAKEVRKFNNQAKIIFITGFRIPELCKEATKYNIFDYIIKPISTEEILNSIQDALE